MRDRIAGRAMPGGSERTVPGRERGGEGALPRRHRAVSGKAVTGVAGGDPRRGGGERAASSRWGEGGEERRGGRSGGGGGAVGLGRWVYISHGAGVSRALRERRSALGAPGREPRPHPGPTRPATRPGAGGNSGLPLAEGGRPGKPSQGPRPDVPVCVRTTTRAVAPARARARAIGHPGARGSARRFGRRIVGRHVTFGRGWRAGERELAHRSCNQAPRGFEFL